MEGNFKIIMTTDTIGGVWTYSMELCAALRDYPVEIHLVGLGGYPSKSQKKEVEKLKNVTFYPKNYKLEWMENSEKGTVQTEWKIYELCKRIQPDLLHFNNYVRDGRIWGIRKITVFHSCVQTWWQAVKGEQVPESWNSYLELVENALNSSDVAVFPSKAIRDKAFELHRISPTSVVIPNARTKKRRPEEPKEKIILCCGRIWDEAKNLSLLCSIAPELPWPVYVAGDNKNPNADDEKELENVRFLGKLTPEEVQCWMNHTPIYVNAAHYEPFGLAVLEAANSGCALVLSDIDTLREIWGDSTLYFNPNDADSLREVLLQLIEDSEKLFDYQQRAEVRAERYNPEDFGRTYFQLYQKLISENPVLKPSKSITNKSKTLQL